MRFRFSFACYAHNAKYLCNTAAIRENSVGEPCSTDFRGFSRLIDGLCHKTGVVLYWSFMVPDINSRRFSFFPSFHAKRRKAGVTGRQRPCAGSGGESLRAQKRARSGGKEAASRRAERMRHVRAADRRCTVCFRGVYSHTAHRPCPHPA